MTVSRSDSDRASLWYLDGRVAAAFLLMSGLLHIGYELTLGVPDVFSEPVLRLSVSAILAFGLVRRYSWAWWGSVLTGGLWLVLDFMRVSVTFALSGIDPRDLGTELLIICAFIAQAVAIALLLRMRTGLRPALTLGITLLGLLVVVLGLWKIGGTAIVPGESDLGGPIYAAVVERVGIPAVKVVTGTVNGVKGIRVVIADSILSAADSATQLPRSTEIAMLVRSLLPAETAFAFIGVGWSMDTGPGAMPEVIHRFQIEELGEDTDSTPE